jgi:hypothetical protein
MYKGVYQGMVDVGVAVLLDQCNRRTGAMCCYSEIVERNPSYTAQLEDGYRYLTRYLYW